jgi:hypothetical protein
VVDVGLEDKIHGQKIMAMGLIDGDMKVDLVTTNYRSDSFQVHYFKNNEGVENRFLRSSWVKVDPEMEFPKIEGVLVANDNQNLKSLLITYRKHDSDPNSFLKVFSQTEVGVFEENT